MCQLVRDHVLTDCNSQGKIFFVVVEFYPFFSPISWYPIVVVATILSHRYNSRTGSGETKVESHASSDTQPNQAALLLNTVRIQPGSQPHQCAGGNTVHRPPWLAHTAPSPPQESLVRDETRISLPTKPSLTRATLGQLCVTPRTSRSRPVTTEPGREPSWRCRTAPLTTAPPGRHKYIF